LPKLYEGDSKLSRTADTTSERERGVKQVNINIKESYMPEYTKVITFECEGEEYLAEVYVGKNCSDYNLYQGNKKLEDKPAWLEKAELDPEFNFLFFIDELGWEYERNGISEGEVKV
jgi:hypothetical protein